MKSLAIASTGALVVLVTGPGCALANPRMADDTPTVPRSERDEHPLLDKLMPLRDANLYLMASNPVVYLATVCGGGSCYIAGTFAQLGAFPLATIHEDLVWIVQMGPAFVGGIAAGGPIYLATLPIEAVLEGRVRLDLPLPSW